MNPDDAYDSATKYLGDLDAEKAAYSVAVMVVASATVIYLLKRSGFRAMVAVGKG